MAEMELYILDSLLRRVKIVEKYESLIWSERFNSAGDFQLSIESTIGARSDLVPDTWLATNVSNRCMKIETVEDSTDDEGRKMLDIKGPSIEMELDSRVAFGVLDDLTTVPKWVITDQPADIARKIFTDICVTGILDVKDIIPFMTVVAVYPDDSIPEPTDTITVELDPQSVYEAVKGICEPWDLGFRLIRNQDLSQLVFDVYSGSDRTTNQDVLEPVIFSPDYDNLRNTKELTSSAGVKNVAYVFSQVGYEIVYAEGLDPDTVGFDRRVLYVDASDIDDPVPANATAKMILRGQKALNEHRNYAAFDGEISQTSQYQYDVHYYLGDLVEVRNEDGVANFMRVTEQIFVSDREGDRSYPSLTLNKLITPDSWLGWPNKTWFDYDSDPLVWEDA